MSELPVIEVYCEGTKTAPHKRFIIAAYRRAHANSDFVTAWIALDWWKNRRLRKVELPRHDANYNRVWLSFQLPCRRCALHEIRISSDGEFAMRMYTVFDKLWSQGVDPLEVSARGLLRAVESD
ncbi:hypothetical protein [Mycobacterium intracellulare]|uniref:hypothetical protein n=1 Tax=Mycobacterium intracellulare TaxID=1767 RepID=UPI0034D41752